jgi:hypothetical protein
VRVNKFHIFVHREKLQNEWKTWIIYKKKQIQEQERGERENQKKNKNRKTAFPQIHEKKIQNGRGKKIQKNKTDKNAFLH